MAVTLSEIVHHFAEALIVVDQQRPSWVSQKERRYLPGIGPHPEDRAVDLIIGALRGSRHALRHGATIQIVGPSVISSLPIQLTERNGGI